MRRLMTAILVDAVHCYQADAYGWTEPEGSAAWLWIFGEYPEFSSPSATYAQT